MVIICGIDEAGKGPVIGPLIVAGVVIEAEREGILKDLGARDSKALTPLKREVLFDKIYEESKRVETRSLSTEEIDRAVLSKDSNLNELETAAIAAIINTTKPDKAYIDCPSNNIDGWVRQLRRMLDVDVEIVAAHKADSKFPSVSAASIVAKVLRDRDIAELKKKFSVEFGSGYPADPRTKSFIEKHYKDYPFFRKSWATYRKLVDLENQHSLRDF